ncbi:MAG TPA: GFA family protein [Gammaproteobacteria bacterium]|nr:GFA family protein [Gammaproteobacteria bacterium]
MAQDNSRALTGGCLCAGVRYRIDGKCRDIICCHCENCRRTHGHVAAYTALPQSSLTLLSADTLQWYHDVSPDTYRGFCNRCGASLFWDLRDGRKQISVAAGSLDDSGELKVIGHIFVAEAGSYYEINDGLPRFQGGSAGALEKDGDG